MSSVLGEAEPTWRAQRRSRIVSATVGLLREGALDQVQMTEVAAAANVGKATLYRYFASKQALFLACFDAFMDELCAGVEAAEHDVARPADRLRAIIEVSTGVLVRHKSFLRLLTRRKADLDDDSRRGLLAGRARLMTTLRHNLEDGMRQSDYRGADMDVVPALILGMLRGAIIADSAAPLKQLSQTMADLVLNGLTASHAGPSAERES